MFNAIQTLLRKAREAILAYVLPSRMKRLIVLASLTFKFEEKGTLSVLTVDKVNTLLNLATRRSALPYSIHVGQVIWQDRLIVDVVQELQRVSSPTPVNLRPLAEKIMQVIPSYLRWDDSDAIERDIVKLLRFEKTYA